MNEEIEKKIKTLEELDLVDYPHENIVQLINSVKVGLPIMTVIIPKWKRLVRSRLNGNVTRFNKKEELSFVPSDKNKSYARASTPKNTMFYASTSAPNQKSSIRDVEISFYETVNFLNNKNSLGYAKITYGNWFPKEDLLLLAIIPYTKEYDKNNFIGEMKKDYNENLKSTSGENLTKASKDFLELMSSEFSKRVNEDFEYMKSAIFTEIIMKTNSYHGVFYPSVKSDDTCYNIALKPEVVDKLSLKLVVECSIFKNKELIDFCDDATASVNESGNFDWYDRDINNSHSTILKKIGIASIEELKKLVNN